MGGESILVTRLRAVCTDSSMIGLPLDLMISELLIVPSGLMWILTVQTKDLSCSKIEVGCSHWLKKRSWMRS